MDQRQIYLSQKIYSFGRGSNSSFDDIFEINVYENGDCCRRREVAGGGSGGEIG